MGQKEVRVRFAPSPTGPLHMGGVRTALFNYLFARKHGGKFILRIEDTDQKRYVEKAEEYIMESLRWCGIHPDEGPQVGGSHGPYRQSERKAHYRKYVDLLLEKGHAYYAFDTPEELEQMRTELKTDKNPNPQYDCTTRMRMKNALSLSAEEVEERLASGQPYVVRYKMPEDETIVINDLVRGRVEMQSRLQDDKVLFKPDGLPTYHLANVVDDLEMEISHVIRGEEWLPSKALHVMLYRSLGREQDMPRFAHLPLILKPEGKGKLSKRDGDKGGFPVFPLDWQDPASGDVYQGFREKGYYPEAFINILAMLGWSPGTEQELFSLDELSQAFSLERVQKAGARFDPEKARWFNNQYLQKRDPLLLSGEFAKVLRDRGVEADTIYIKQVVELVRERANFVHELWGQSAFFFRAPEEYDAKTVKKRWKEDSPQIVSQLKEVLADTLPFKAENAEQAVKSYIEGNGISMGKAMIGLRLMLVGAGQGPDLFKIAELIGRDECISRIEKGLKALA